MQNVTTIKASDTLEHQPMVWPVPNACAQSYHLLGTGQAVDFLKSPSSLARPWVAVRVCHLLLLSLLIKGAAYGERLGVLGRTITVA